MISCDFSQTLLFPKMRAMVCDSYIVCDWKMPFSSWIRKFVIEPCCGVTSNNKTFVRFTNYSDNETSALKNSKYLPFGNYSGYRSCPKVVFHPVYFFGVIRFLDFFFRRRSILFFMLVYKLGNPIRGSSLCSLDDKTDGELWDEAVYQFSLDELEEFGRNLDEAIRNSLANDLNWELYTILHNPSDASPYLD